MNHHEFRIGGTVYRGYRYWRNLGNPFGYPGWNTAFLAYRIIDITPQRIKVEHVADTMFGKAKTLKDYKPLYLNLATMERDGNQYHTRFHEYFYAKRPKFDPEHEFRISDKKHHLAPPSILQLPRLYTRDDVKRAYKRLAHVRHPDHGGSHEAFLELQRARDEALQYAI